jgi:hypothetical protein
MISNVSTITKLLAYTHEHLRFDVNSYAVTEKLSESS